MTKSPIPAIDGGRLVAASTIEALTQAGADITVVAPSVASHTEPPSTASLSPVLIGTRLELVQASPASWSRAAWRSLRSGRPLSIERHASAAVADRVAALRPREAFDLVHIEQPQALASAAPAIAAGLPSVLRAQNVESDVWRAAAMHDRWRAPLLLREARRFQRFERDALARVDATIALSVHDAAHFTSLDPLAHIVTVPPPFALPPRVAPIVGHADTADRPDPSFTWIGSNGWHVNQDAVDWLESDVWPAIASRVPRARLRLFGGVATAMRGASADPRVDAAPPRHTIARDTIERHTIERHAAPADCAAAFTPDTILLLPLRRVIGIRMRLLDAWARGVPVIATPAAVAGLAAADGANVLLADTPRAFAEAGARLTADPALRATLVHGGRATLARDHAPAVVARAILAVYAEAIARHRTRR